MAEKYNPEEANIVSLVDENGVEADFEIIGNIENEGTTYFALIPVEGDGDEYVILKAVPSESGDADEFDDLISIDDDEEFDRIADIFDDLLMEEYDYDEDGDKTEYVIMNVSAIRTKNTHIIFELFILQILTFH